MDIQPDRPMNLQADRRNTAPLWRIAIGLLVVSYGAILLLHNLGFDLHIAERAFVPFGVMILGAMAALQSHTPMGRTIGAVVVIGGGAWTYAAIVGTRVDLNFWWPIVLMAVGVIFLVRSREGVSESAAAVPGGPAEASAVAFWSGVRRRVTSAAFSRADFVAVMGGIEADFRPAMTAGGTAVVEVFVMMGGIEITVPPDWAVVNRAAVIMGGVTDHSTGARGAANTLYIQGVVVMGGVEIKT